MRLRALVAVAVLAGACSAGGGDGEPAQGGGSTNPPGQSTQATAGGTGGPTCWTADVPGAGAIELTDVTEAAGLVEPLLGMHGHTAIWTDTNGDDRPDLYVGTFADRDDEIYQERGAEGPSPDRLLVSDGAAFAVDETLAETRSRSSGGVGVDLDGDGDLDVVVARNIKDAGLGETPTQVLENDGGTLTPVTEAGIPDELGGRSIGALDYDGDGLLDLFIAEDRWTGGSSVLLHNEGSLGFRDATAEAGIPTDVHGLGVATADLDGDGGTDIFVSGSNRLFLSDGDGFTETDDQVFQWEIPGEEDDVAGVSVADVNRDGRLDIAIGQHFNSTVEDGLEVSVRLYLNEGDGVFRDVTEEAGLIGLPTKAPHVELNDFDNDGWPDLLTSAAAGEGPAIFRHEGLEGGVPRFATPDGLGPLQYWVAAPTADYDRDGRLDVFLLEWEPSLPSLLLRNESDSGNWLEVSVDAAEGFGIGWRVEARDGDEVLGAREITVTQGYSAGVLPVAHFGLGETATVDLLLTPPGGDTITLEDVPANQHLRWPNGCG